MDEEKLLKADLFDALMDCLPEMIYFKDTSGRFLQISDYTARKLGLSHPSEALGKTDYDFFSSENPQEKQDDEQLIMETGVPMENKEEFLDRPGEEREWYLTTKAPFYNSRGTLQGTVGLSHNITRLLPLYQFLRQHHSDSTKLMQDISNRLHIILEAHMGSHAGGMEKKYPLDTILPRFLRALSLHTQPRPAVETHLIPIKIPLPQLITLSLLVSEIAALILDLPMAGSDSTDSAGKREGEPSGLEISCEKRKDHFNLLITGRGHSVPGHIDFSSTQEIHPLICRTLADRIRARILHDGNQDPRFILTVPFQDDELGREQEI